MNNQAAGGRANFDFFKRRPYGVLMAAQMVCIFWSVEAILNYLTVHCQQSARVQELWIFPSCYFSVSDLIVGREQFWFCPSQKYHFLHLFNSSSCPCRYSLCPCSPRSTSWEWVSWFRWLSSSSSPPSSSTPFISSDGIARYKSDYCYFISIEEEYFEMILFLSFYPTN